MTEALGETSAESVVAPVTPTKNTHPDEEEATPADLAPGEEKKEQVHVLLTDGIRGLDLGEEHSEWETFLNEDIYSLLYVTEVGTGPFFYSLFWMALQWSMLALVLADIIMKGSPDNPLSVPEGVSIIVTLCQPMALVLASAMADDMLIGIESIHQGHFIEGANHLRGATDVKWYLASVFQTIAGVLLLIVIFCLVMQSTDIIGMFLNFAALQFLAEIDNVAFKLAHYGFVSRSVRESCESVRTVQRPSKLHLKKRYRAGLFLLTTFLLLSGYGIIVGRQRNGDYLCEKVLVQFGDDFGTSYSAFSGFYVQTKEKLVDERVTYAEEKRQGTPGAGEIAYCAKEKAWTLYLNGNDPCDWVAKSPESESYDFTATGSSNWIVKRPGSGRVVQYASFFLACNDCTTDLCNSQEGVCVDNTCECLPGRHGANCDFQEPCPVLQADFRFQNFPDYHAGLIRPPQTFELLEGKVDGYDKAIYTGMGYFGSHEELFIVRFTGRRYVVYNYGANQSVPFEEQFNDFVEGLPTFHGYYSEFNPGFVSDPLNFGTDSDSFTPEGARWIKARWAKNSQSQHPVLSAGGGTPAQTILLCTECDSTTNPCLNDYWCQDDSGKCQCNIEDDPYFGLHSGALCEQVNDCVDVSCWNGGQCQASGVCDCPSNYTGTFCEYAADFIE